MNHIYIAMAGHIVCLDKSCGDEIWRSKIKSPGSSAFTNLVVDGEIIIAYAGGHLFALEASNGEILWENKLPGLGYNSCIIAGSNSGSLSAQASAVQSTAAQAALIAGAAVVSTST